MTTKFLLDENIPYALIDFLEKRGFSVEHLKKLQMGGIKNGDVYKIAEKGKMWIITRDAGFQNYYRFGSHDIAGIILIKLTATKTNYLLKAMERFLAKYQDKLLEKHLIIVEDEIIRIY
jgi:predicted nuclease of predicted toxin-antitoxin system